MFGGRDRVAGRGVDDGDPGRRGRSEIDVVDADTRPADDLEAVSGGGDHVRVDLDLAPDDKGVVAGQDRAELVAGEIWPLVDLDDARPRESAVPSQQRDSVVGKPALLAGVGTGVRSTKP